MGNPKENRAPFREGQPRSHRLFRSLLGAEDGAAAIQPGIAELPLVQHAVEMDAVVTPDGEDAGRQWVVVATVDGQGPTYRREWTRLDVLVAAELLVDQALHLFSFGQHLLGVLGGGHLAAHFLELVRTEERVVELVKWKTS